LSRYIATVETAKHRVFQFLDNTILPDNMLVAIGTDDAFHLGVLSSRIHVTWALMIGGTLEDRPRYTKSICFDPFPFPDCPDRLKNRIRAVAEELDIHRKTRQAEHPQLTLTQMYNVLDKLRSGKTLNHNDERIKNDGLVLVLKDLHDQLDTLVFEAYGWPIDLDDEEILTRLVELNKERAAEEKEGKVRWLRPEYQIPRFGSEAERARLEEERRRAREEALFAERQPSLDLEDSLQEMKPRYPTGDELAETAAVIRVMATAEEPLSISAICSYFSQGRQVEKRVASTVFALARLGHLTSTDDGNTFSLRRFA
jgi:Fe2+ or Zn2+ uptake regulation protein